MKDQTNLEFQERYFLAQNATSIYCTCTIRSFNNVNLFLVLNDQRSISWPTRNCDNIFEMNSHFLSNIPSNLKPANIFSVVVSDNRFVYVVATDDLDGNHCIFCYQLKYDAASDKLNLFPSPQHFGIFYRPLDVATISDCNDVYLLVTGCDFSIHIYSVDDGGSLHRRTSRSSKQLEWETRMETKLTDSFGIRFLVEEWKNGDQGVIGFANGLLYWDSMAMETATPPIASPEAEEKLYLRPPISPTSPHVLRFPPRGENLLTIVTEEGDEEDEDEEDEDEEKEDETEGKVEPTRGKETTKIGSEDDSDEDFGPPPEHQETSTGFNKENKRNNNNGNYLKQVNNRQALLLDGAITCLCFYHPERTFLAASYAPSARHAFPGAVNSTSTSISAATTNPTVPTMRDQPSRYIAAGTSEGAAVIIPLGCGCSSNFQHHCHVVLPGAFIHGGIQAMTIADVTLNGYEEVIIGCEDGTVIIAVRDLLSEHEIASSDVELEKHSISRSSPRCNILPMRFRLAWSVQLSFPVLGLSFGAITGPALKISGNSNDNNNNDTCVEVYHDQLAVQTTKSLHLFTFSNSSAGEQNCSNQNNNCEATDTSGVDAFSAKLMAIERLATILARKALI